MTYKVWVSTDGKYFALRAPSGHSGAYDVVAADCSGAWLSHRYTPTGFADTDLRYVYAEFPQMVASWRNRGHALRSGRWIEAFDITFSNCRQDIPVERYTGNVVLQTWHAAFRTQRRVSRQVWDAIQARLAETAAQTPGKERCDE